jgi:hypothetical protein
MYVGPSIFDSDQGKSKGEMRSSYDDSVASKESDSEVSIYAY